MSQPVVNSAAKQAIFKRAHQHARSLSLSIGTYAQRLKIALSTAWIKFKKQEFEFRAFWTEEFKAQQRAQREQREWERMNAAPQKRTGRWDRTTQTGSYIPFGA